MDWEHICTEVKTVLSSTFFVDIRIYPHLSKRGDGWTGVVGPLAGEERRSDAGDLTEIAKEVLQ